MNPNAVPTIIRGVSLMPGSVIYQLSGRVRSLGGYAIFGDLDAQLIIVSRELIATNGVGVAWHRKGRGRVRSGRAPFHYYEPHELTGNYLVSEAERDAAIAAEKRDRLVYARELLVESDAAVALAQERSARLRSLVAKLSAAKDGAVLGDQRAPDAVEPAAELEEAVHG